jgi:16S rRNA (cytidine1402-2'-O)-methyltransferase
VSIESGVLYVVATPLGNLADITYRAVQVLKNVDLIAAEDTRHSGLLLRHYAIDTPMISLHEHNEYAQVKGLLERLQAGESVALISDAGTPLISDPGFRLVAAGREAGVRVSPIPGPSALIAALSAAGVPTDRFVFEGFLPAKAAARRQRLQALKSDTRTLVFFEASHRIAVSLDDMRRCLGDARSAVVGRELTKVFEELHGDTLEALCRWIHADPNRLRGEFVVVVDGAAPTQDQNAADTRRALTLLLAELPLKTAVRLAAVLTSQKKNEVYEMALALTRERDAR